ncbi:hypothetical protein A2690_04515 [Candidatus Roizmanbacteria bacterium RIFCSPHIGHO2_01_FULL_39_12b]|uniref:PIN domain-containing protein n=1 Tax=Candidatus Roizmanbacteria bacterium RIFCSPHIGHO2_01_FULL_39_12b TaxID=1802030 RepID=A0A1F7GAG0_9BACT|nr:MAG: hypothetical protein A2690_04515 [Candidatus Roizmanbacteria bacterium RIFCSPHIGHO2_01_FULL_39_12b]
MKYLLDTNVIIDHLRKRHFIEIDWVASGCAISIITLGELYYGTYKSNRPQETLKAVIKLIEDSGISIVYLDETIMKIYGETKAELETKGERVDDFDLMIGATALVNDYVLITRNKKHFERIKNLRLI